MLLDKFIPASKIEDKEDISESEKESEEDSDSLKEESEKSDRTQKIIRKPVDERSIEDQGENDMSEEWNAMDEPLLERDYY